jgi:ribosome maturation factor RimP
MRDEDTLAVELEERVSRLGFELVELERTGSKTRPILRLRIDRPDSSPGHGVSVDDCARVSREIEAFLDSDEQTGGRYVLEVSSPGVERPLVRRGDFERFAGHEIAVLGHVVLAGRSRRLEGELLGIQGTGNDEELQLKLGSGEVVRIRRADVDRAHLVFQWP